MKYKKDNRDKLWATLEKKIQKHAIKKDRNFRLTGKWKIFLKNQSKFKVFLVDGEWVRTNLSVTFGHGGQGYGHEFIAHNEIWIGTHHPSDCDCNNVRKDRRMSKKYQDSTILHEIEEFARMKEGMIYWHAHQEALQKEIEAKLIPDPYSEAS